MGYANPIEAMGLERFADAARQAGVDGVLVIDYPPEESAEFAQCSAHAIDMIFLLAPTSTETRIEQVARLASGYIYYCVAARRDRGQAPDLDDVAAKLPAIRGKTRLPVGVGFASAMDRPHVRGPDRRRCRDRQPNNPRMEQASPGTCVEKGATFLKEIRRAIDA